MGAEKIPGILSSPTYTPMRGKPGTAGPGVMSNLEKTKSLSFGIIPEETGHQDNDRTGRFQAGWGKENRGQFIYLLFQNTCLPISSESLGGGFSPPAQPPMLCLPWCDKTN